MPTVEIVACKTKQEALDLLRYALENGYVIPTKHFREELAAEGCSMVDAWCVLRTGHIYDPPEHDIKRGEWKYRIQGREPGGKTLAIVFSFKAVKTAVLITVFSI